MSFQRFCRRNAEIAALCGIPIAHVSTDQIFGFEMGWMETGARSPRWLATYLRDREPVLTVAPYTVYPVPGGAFPDDEQWPNPMPFDLITQEDGT
jgi:hypothetical protein